MSGEALDKKVVTRQLKTLERVIRKNDSMIVGWLTRKFGDQETAKDIAQDVYLRVWRYAHETLIENPQAILFKTASNLAANEFRARHRFRLRHLTTTIDEDGGDPIQNLASDDPSPERAAEARSDMQASMAAIDRLPEKARRAFVMSRFQEMSYQDIARELGVSVSSVEKYIITALKALRVAVAIQEEKKRKVIAFPIRNNQMR